MIWSCIVFPLFRWLRSSVLLIPLFVQCCHSSLLVIRLTLSCVFVMIMRLLLVMMTTTSEKVVSLATNHRSLRPLDVMHHCWWNQRLTVISSSSLGFLFLCLLLLLLLISRCKFDVTGSGYGAPLFHFLDSG